MYRNIKILIILKIIFENAYCKETKNSNVLFLVIDDLRPIFDSYGDQFAITPYLDKIANEGIVFGNAFAQQALCGPSRTSFLTSRRPDTTRLVDTHYYWRRHAGNFTTIPQYFKEHGYDTQSVGKIFHPGVASNHNDDQPYSWTEPPYHPSSHKYKNFPVCLSKDGKLHSNIYCPVKVKEMPEKTLPDIQSAEFSLNWLYQRAKKSRTCLNDKENDTCSSKPFFLAVGFHKPHIPLKFPMEFLELYRLDSVPLAPNRYLPKGLPLVAWNPWNDLRRRDDISSLNLSFPFGPMPDDYSKYLRQGYYAATSYMDSLLGLVVTRVKYLFPNTIIVIIGDHGWSLGEHQEWSKFSNYEVATKVPFILSIPKEEKYSSHTKSYSLKDERKYTIKKKYFKNYIKLNEGKTCFDPKNSIVYKKEYLRYDKVVELLDVFPTLVDLVGLPSLPSCPEDSSKVKVCTEGISLYCNIQQLISLKLHLRTSENMRSCPTKRVAISQFPRPSMTPSADPDSDQPRLTETKIMGYSLRTNRYRYTSWLKFNHTTFKVDPNRAYGEELYDHFSDKDENNNLIFSRTSILTKMRKLLKVHLNHEV